jgi:hypothetical protein
VRFRITFCSENKSTQLILDLRATRAVFLAILHHFNLESLVGWPDTIPQIVLLNPNRIAFARMGTRVKQQSTVYTKRKAVYIGR